MESEGQTYRMMYRGWYKFFHFWFHNYIFQTSSTTQTMLQNLSFSICPFLQYIKCWNLFYFFFKFSWSWVHPHSLFIFQAQFLQSVVHTYSAHIFELFFSKSDRSILTYLLCFHFSLLGHTIQIKKVSAILPTV